MKKAVFAVNLLALSIGHALAAELPTITIEATRLSDVSGEEVKSADLAESLTKNLSSVSLVRRSGIANDILLRGQKKDNINILIDNAKIYGACPNRMDPPTSHVLTNLIESIDVIKGPYDVQNFGTLSGAVEIHTQKPSKEFKGEISANVGSWDYRKLSATFSGGSERARYLLSMSNESSAQYEDGDGHDFYEQIENLNTDPNFQYKDIYRNIDAYEKKTLMGKFFLDVTDNQEMRLSYTVNRSDDILYPSSQMDALYDDSNILNIEYTFSNLGKYSKSLDIQYYSSDVEHPMSTFYRNSSGPDSANEKISMLTSDIQGIKIKDTFDLSDSAELTLGVDASTRNWDGEYLGEGMQSPVTGAYSIPDVDTENKAIFAEINKHYTDASIKAGVRYDDTSIIPNAASSLPDNDYSSFSANIMATIQGSETSKYFIGLGKASRVPDARELYFTGAKYDKVNDIVKKPLIGTPTLEQVTNTEIDIGMENRFEAVKLKTRLFHSWLEDYIYYHFYTNMGMPVMNNNFENIDATLYGLEVDGHWYISDEFTLDFGLSYLRGEKDEALQGQTDTDLAEVPPLKANLKLNYEYSYLNTASIELIAADAWDSFDADNGEQALPGYGVVNLKLTHNFTNKFELTVGIDNLLDRTYAVSNTYKDLTLLTDGTGDVMLMNEPGRYTYINGTYKF